MADILPFRALRYNPQLVPVPQAVTQPYDKISPAMQDRYYAASPYNLVRIILGRGEDQDNTEHNVYTRAAAYFRDWRQQAVLQREPEASIYAYSQRFQAPGSGAEQVRLGFIALGRIEDYSSQVVFRHEQTLIKPKADRLELLRTTRAHFGQIFMLYEDPGEVDSLISSGTSGHPEVEVEDECGVVHRVWPISDPGIIDSVQRKMRDKRLIIADGHHRYETALSYRDERRSADSRSAIAASTPGDASYEFLMMTFVNMNSPALLILPTHRVIQGIQGFSGEAFKSKSGQFLQVEEVGTAFDGARAGAILREKGTQGAAILAVTHDRALLLHHPKPSASQFLAGLSQRQQSLDVVLLHKCLLEGVLNLSQESIRNQQHISYVRDADEAMAQVRTRKANVAFLMNPCPVEQVRDIAFANEVLPQKSTDFYPKLLSGLTIYALE